MRRSSICLFDGADRDNIAPLAPYLLKMSDLSGGERERFFAVLSSGQAILFSSQRNIQELKRHFKKFILQPNDQGKTIVNKFYTSINFLFYLETERNFLRIFEFVDYVLCRTFDEPYQYARIELSSGGVGG